MMKYRYRSLQGACLILLTSLLIAGCSLDFKQTQSARRQPVPQIKPDYTEPILGIPFVIVPAGSYTMGDETQKRQEALPLRQVTINALAVGMYEITFEQFDKFCEATNREKPQDAGWGRGKTPVINVSWEEAKAFSDWLSQKSGLSISLPSEAQWEYFARAGSSSRYWSGDVLAEDGANCSNCGSPWDGKTPSPVGSFPPNPWGLYDTAGNVAEWTLDDYHPDYNGAPQDGSAWVASTTADKIYRGGAWDYPVEDLTSAMRDWTSKDSKLRDVGFRVVINDFQAPKPAK